MSSKPSQKHAVAFAAGVALYPVLFVIWLVVLEILLRFTIGVGVVDFSIAVPFGYGLGGLLLWSVAVVAPPLIVSALLLRAWKLPASSAVIAGALFIGFMVFSGATAAREGTKHAKESLQRLKDYGDDIKKGATVGAIEITLSDEVTPENNAHYVRQFKQAFQMAKVQIPLQVGAPGRYRFELTISGTYPASRWSEATEKNMPAVDQTIEKRFEWDASLSAGAQQNIHEIPAAELSRTTSWVSEPNGTVALRLFRIMTLDERLGKLGVSKNEELDVPADKLFTEPVLESSQRSSALPVSWMIAR